MLSGKVFTKVLVNRCVPKKTISYVGEQRSGWTVYERVGSYRGGDTS